MGPLYLYYRYGCPASQASSIPKFAGLPEAGALESLYRSNCQHGQGGSRTHTALRPQDFKSGVYAIPPLAQWVYNLQNVSERKLLDELGFAEAKGVNALAKASRKILFVPSNIFDVWRRCCLTLTSIQLSLNLLEEVEINFVFL